MTRIPKWVSSYPSEIDRNALISVAESSEGNLEGPREMNFVLYDFASKESLDAAMNLMQEKGWTCQYGPQDEDPSLSMIIAQKQGYIIEQDSYEADTSFFKRVANMYDAHYDGWFASN